METRGVNKMKRDGPREGGREGGREGSREGGRDGGRDSPDGQEGRAGNGIGAVQVEEDAPDHYLWGGGEFLNVELHEL